MPASSCADGCARVQGGRRPPWWRVDQRGTKARKYSYDATVVLGAGVGRLGWVAGGSAWRRGWKTGWTRWNLVPGQGRNSAQVPKELLAMSPATIE